MERAIEGPGPYKPRYTSQEAGQYIGVGNELFDALMAEHMPTVRPVYLGKQKLWQWMDLAVLNFLVNRAITPQPAKKRGEEEEK